MDTTTPSRGPQRRHDGAVLRAACAGLLALGTLAAGAALPAAAQTSGARPASRGELLYTLHCVACHSTQMHWRDRRLATDWPSLRAQVQRWQATAQLGWSDDDVTEVARHLNDAFYGFPQARPQVGQAGAPRRPGAPAAPG